ncbi:MAG: MFS transporter [Victivallales bacterium]|nr:MFS transporter [Victivallales bacterium]MCF7889237.1 MFS transporter [Victivallales bacterium]
MKTKQKVIAASLLMIVLKIANRFGASLYMVTLPAIALSVGLSSVAVRFSMSIFLIGAIIAYILTGMLSSKYSTVTLLIGGAAVFTFSSILIAVNHSLFSIMFGRFFQGLGIGFAPAFGNVLIAEAMSDNKPDKDKILSVLLAYSSIIIVWAPAIGMIIGGFLQVHYGWESNFEFLAAVGFLLIILLTLFKLKVGSGEQKKKPVSDSLKGYLFFIGNKEYMKMVLPFAIASSGITAYYLISSFVYSKAFHLPPHYVGYLSLFQVGGFLGGKLLSVFFLRFDWDTHMKLSFSICLISSLIMNLGVFGSHFDIIIIITSIIGYSLGLGLMMPYISAKVMVIEPNRKAVGSAFLMLLVLSSMSISGGIVSFFHVQHIRPLGIFLTVLSILALSILQLYKIKSKQKPI